MAPSRNACSSSGSFSSAFRHAQSLLGPARSVAKEALDVLGEAAEAEVTVDAGSKGTDQPGTLLPVEMCAALGESRELLMYVLPIELLGHEIH